MSRGIAAPDGWHPQTQQDRDAVLHELQKVLASPHFCNSKRYPALLKYIVENTLAGKSDLLKERTLGVEVFDRPATYDTNADTVVRYTAGEVRKRLLLFYHEDGRDSSIRISLPAGSYIPEFLHWHDKGEEAGTDTRLSLNTEGLDDRAGAVVESALAMQPAIGDRPSMSAWPPRVVGSLSRGRRRAFFSFLPWALLAAVIVAVAIAGFMWNSRIVHPQTTVGEFWAPILRDQKTVVICAGSSVFAQNPYSGLFTAGTDRNVEYPFVSMQTAAAISLIEAAMERSGIQTQLIAAPWTSLTDLREHSVTLIGGYNNKWTLRLTEPLRFHFAPDPQATIVDAMQPKTRFERDPSVPYSSADDYALIARFRDPTTNGWIMVLAGLGRNGTEAAAQFVTGPNYMDLLRARLGTGFGNQNIEVVLKVRVIEGKTGAPSILAAHTW